MSVPNIPSVTPTISISRGQVVNLLLASIAFEELGLAHIINAEAEKLQAVLGTAPVFRITASSVSQLLSVNQSVNRTLQTALKTQMLLQFKLEEVIGLANTSPTPPPPPPPPGLCPANITLVAGSTMLGAGGVTTLSGKVTDSHGTPLPNVQVIITSDAGNVSPASVSTNAIGNYSTTFSAPGSAGGVVAFAAVAGTTIVGAENLIVS